MLDSILKKEFVRRILVETGTGIDRDQAVRINKLLHFKSGDLLRNKSIGENKVSFPSGTDGELTIIYPIYERFLDMKTKKMKRSFPIHNSIIWGWWGRMQYMLQNNFTEEVKKELHEYLKTAYNGQN